MHICSATTVITAAACTDCTRTDPECTILAVTRVWTSGVRSNLVSWHRRQPPLRTCSQTWTNRPQRSRAGTYASCCPALGHTFPNTVLQSSNAHAAAEPTWGAIKYVREGEPQLLNEEDAAMMTAARDQYSQAVESSLAAAEPGSPVVVGQGVRQAFRQVRVMPKMSVSAL